MARSERQPNRGRQSGARTARQPAGRSVVEATRRATLDTMQSSEAGKRKQARARSGQVARRASMPGRGDAGRTKAERARSERPFADRLPNPVEGAALVLFGICALILVSLLFDPPRVHGNSVTGGVFFGWLYRLLGAGTYLAAALVAFWSALVFFKNKVTSLPLKGFGVLLLAMSFSTLLAILASDPIDEVRFGGNIGSAAAILLSGLSSVVTVPLVGIVLLISLVFATDWFFSDLFNAAKIDYAVDAETGGVTEAEASALSGGLAYEERRLAGTARRRPSSPPATRPAPTPRHPQDGSPTSDPDGGSPRRTPLSPTGGAGAVRPAAGTPSPGRREAPDFVTEPSTVRRVGRDASSPTPTQDRPAAERMPEAARDASSPAADTAAPKDEVTAKKTGFPNAPRIMRRIVPELEVARPVADADAAEDRDSETVTPISARAATAAPTSSPGVEGREEAEIANGESDEGVRSADGMRIFMPEPHEAATDEAIVDDEEPAVESPTADGEEADTGDAPMQYQSVEVAPETDVEEASDEVTEDEAEEAADDVVEEDEADVEYEYVDADEDEAAEDDTEAEEDADVEYEYVEVDEDEADQDDTEAEEDTDDDVEDDDADVEYEYVEVDEDEADEDDTEAEEDADDDVEDDDADVEYEYVEVDEDEADEDDTEAEEDAGDDVEDDDADVEYEYVEVDEDEAAEDDTEAEEDAGDDVEDDDADVEYEYVDADEDEDAEDDTEAEEDADDDAEDDDADVEYEYVEVDEDEAAEDDTEAEEDADDEVEDDDADVEYEYVDANEDETAEDDTEADEDTDDVEDDDVEVETPVEAATATEAEVDDSRFDQQSADDIPILYGGFRMRYDLGDDEEDNAQTVAEDTSVDDASDEEAVEAPAAEAIDVDADEDLDEDDTVATEPMTAEEEADYEVVADEAAVARSIEASPNFVDADDEIVDDDADERVVAEDTAEEEDASPTTTVAAIEDDDEDEIAEVDEDEVDFAPADVATADEVAEELVEDEADEADNDEALLDEEAAEEDDEEEAPGMIFSVATEVPSRRHRSAVVVDDASDVDEDEPAGVDAEAEDEAIEADEVIVADEADDDPEPDTTDVEFDTETEIEFADADADEPEALDDATDDAFEDTDDDFVDDTEDGIDDSDALEVDDVAAEAEVADPVEEDEEEIEVDLDADDPFADAPFADAPVIGTPTKTASLFDDDEEVKPKRKRRGTAAQLDRAMDDLMPSLTRMKHKIKDLEGPEDEDPEARAAHLYRRAVEAVVATTRASQLTLQKALNVDVVEADQLLTRLEAEGVIAPQIGRRKTRDVLLTRAEFEEFRDAGVL